MASSIDYSSRDFTSLRSDLTTLIPAYLPEWTNRDPADFGMVMIDFFAYVGDILHYYIDRAANEAFITTAVQRASVLTQAAMLDYRPTGIAAAVATISFTVPADVVGDVTIPAGTQVSTAATATSEPIIFETDEELVVTPGTTDTVDATEGRSYAEDSGSPVGVSDGSSDQIFSLYRTGIIDGSLTLYVDEDAGGPQSEIAWRFREHLIDAGASERAYTTFTTETGVVQVIFGDDTNGRIPVTGAVVTATYRVGVGTAGNVGANTITEAVASLPGVSVITNPAVASGGADVESIDSIRSSAPRSLRTVSRAVTLDDYAALALNVAGVQHAKATGAVYTAPSLYIAPTGGGAPSTDLEDDVENYFADKVMLGATLTVLDPTYLDVNITVNPLHVLPEYSRTAVQTAVENAITFALDISNVDFAYRVSLSLIYRAIAEVEGVDYAVITVLGAPAGLADVVPDDFEIPVLDTLSVTATGGLIGS